MNTTYQRLTSMLDAASKATEDVQAATREAVASFGDLTPRQHVEMRDKILRLVCKAQIRWEALWSELGLYDPDERRAEAIARALLKMEDAK
jgi:hypothetical protein